MEGGGRGDRGMGLGAALRGWRGRVGRGVEVGEKNGRNEGNAGNLNCRHVIDLLT